MKPLNLAAALGLVPCLAACDKEDPAATAATAAAEETFVPAEVEMSPHPRAAAAAAAVRPRLERDLAKIGLRFGDPVFIRAFKEEKELDFHVRNRATGKFDLFRTYRVAATSGTLGPKLAEGDGQVPEGFYQVTPSAMNPDSLFHLSFNLGFPNEFDRSLGRTGSAIMIHGNQVSTGCLAMTDEKIEEIFTLCDVALRNGQTSFHCHVFPFRMTAERMAAGEGDPSAGFWRNLKEGYDRFERDRVPFGASVREGRYSFDP